MFPNQTAWEWVLYRAQMFLNVPTRENTDGQLGKCGPDTPSNAHTSLAPGPQSITAPAPPERVVETEGRNVEKMPRQLPCSSNRVATIPTQQHGLHLQLAHLEVRVQQVLTLVTQKATAPACKWEPRQYPWMQRMHFFSRA